MLNYSKILSVGDKDSYIAPLTAALLAISDLRCSKRDFDGYSLVIRPVGNDVGRKGFCLSNGGELGKEMQEKEMSIYTFENSSSRDQSIGGKFVQSALVMIFFLTSY